MVTVVSWAISPWTYARKMPLGQISSAMVSKTMHSIAQTIGVFRTSTRGLPCAIWSEGTVDAPGTTTQQVVATETHDQTTFAEFLDQRLLRGHTLCPRRVGDASACMTPSDVEAPYGRAIETARYVVTREDGTSKRSFAGAYNLP